MPKYFVWVKGLRGPEAQIWAEKQVNGECKSKEFLSIRELDPLEKQLSLDILKLRYQYV